MLNFWCFSARRLWSPSSHSLRVEENPLLPCGCGGCGLASVYGDCFPEPQVGLHTVSAGFQVDKGLRSGLELLLAQGRTQGPPVGSAGSLRVEGCVAALSASSAVPMVTDSSAGVRPGFPRSSLAVQCPGHPPAPSGEPWVEDSPSLLPVRDRKSVV